MTDLDTTVPEEKINGVKINCMVCMKDFRATDVALLVSKSTDGIINPRCPKCSNEVVATSYELGCPICRNRIFVFSGLLGHQAPCPHCNAQIALPTSEALGKLIDGSRRFKWNVVSSGSGKATTAAGIDDLIDGITTGRFRPNDICAAHAFAPGRKLREACDEYFALRRLYDPLGAHTARCIESIFAIAMVVCIIIAVVLGYLYWPKIVAMSDSIMKFLGGGTTMKSHVAREGFGPHAWGHWIGHAIKWVIGWGVPFGIVMMVSSILAGIPAAIAYWISNTWLKSSGLEKKRVVNWDADIPPQ